MMHQKKRLTLQPLEFKLFKQLIQLDETSGGTGRKILLNLQLSGGRDSMCLFYALKNVFNAKSTIFKSMFLLIVQHFNHNLRGDESDLDALFIERECLNFGIPFYLEVLSPSQCFKGSQQQYYRNWRKEKATKLCKELMSRMDADCYFILTAHHARDQVETVLLHLLRGCGLQGLKGIAYKDEKTGYFRPFSQTLYNEILSYSEVMAVPFREDSSNSNEKYQRNYLRKNILPHFKVLCSDYEKSFLKMLQNVEAELNFQKQKSYSVEGVVASTQEIDIYYMLKNKINLQDISKSCVANILHEAKLLLRRREGTKKIMPLTQGRWLMLIKRGDIVELGFR